MGWQVGDLALAIIEGKNPHLVKPGHQHPRKGGVYRVEAVNIDWLGTLGLTLEGHHSSAVFGAWKASGFRKIKPDTEGANEDDAAWLKDLLAKPKVQVQP